MSELSTNFPPQTYSSSFYINALAEDEKSPLVSNIDVSVEGESKKRPLLDCFISTMTFLFFLPILLYMGYTQAAPNATKECYVDPLGRTRTFQSLLQYQGSRSSFNIHHPGTQGNIVKFDFKTIDRLPKNAFVSFDSDYIMKLSLDGKEIQIIDVGAFLGLFCLQELNLSSNNLTRLYEGSFEGLANLQKLDLSSNFLGNVPDSGLSFLTLKNLRELDLSHNRISTIETYSFMTLSKLQRLKLGFNRIRTIADGVFDYMSSLNVLELNNNYLTDVTPENWKDLSSLSALNLADNYLTSFDTTNNFSFVNLKSLNLSGNNLSKFNVFGMRKHLSKLEILDLDRNSWYCEDLEVIKHQLSDSKITLSSGTNCSEVKSTFTKLPPMERTSTMSTTVASSTKPQRDYAKDVFLQNGEVLVSNRKLEESVNHMQSLLVYLFVVVVLFILVDLAVRIGVHRTFRRCLRINTREGYMDQNDVETVVLMRR